MISRRELLLTMAAAPARSVAITIDDLPRGGDWPTDSTFAGLMALNRDFLAPFRAGKIPLTGFVNSGRGLAPPQMDGLLRLWLAAGAELGNHTHTHPDFNTTPLEEYRSDILECDKALKRVVTKPLYFRHPFLHAGPDRAKREGLEQFLNGHGYKIAPVTLDNADYMFASVYGHALARRDRATASRVRAAYLPYLESIFAFFEQRSVEIFGREIAQILLLHVSRLNADAMPEILGTIARRGYRIVKLEEALTDRAYESRDAYYGPGGFSWIHRWSKTMGLPPRGEPDEPTFIRDEFARTQRR